MVLRVYPDAVVAYREEPLITIVLRPNVHFRPLIAMEFNSVSYEILEQLNHLCGISRNRWQLVMGYHCIILLNSDTQINERLVQDFPTIGRLGRLASRAHSRISQQVVDKLLHPGGAIHSIADKLIGIGIKLARATE